MQKSVIASGAAIAMAVALGASMAAQAPTPRAAAARALAAAKSFTPVKTPWGEPDIQGTYTTTDENGVPLERPDQFPAEEGLSDAEFQRIVKERTDRAREFAGRIGGAETGAGPTHWYEHLDAKNDTLWLISDPADGRFPPMTPDGQKRAADARARRVPEPKKFDDYTLYDRCITRGLIGSTLPVIYGNSLDITQSPGYVAIRNEMIHETRVIPIEPTSGAGPVKPGPAVRNYMGVARGHWEGNTLVIVNTNFTNLTQIGVNGNGVPTSDATTITERITPIDGKTLRWEVTVNDPKTWTRPWTFALPLKKDATQAVFEYACHEGNYAARNMLTGAAAEAAAEGKK